MGDPWKHHVKWRIPVTERHALYGSVFTTWAEEANPQRQKARLAVSRSREEEGEAANGCAVSVQGPEQLWNYTAMTTAQLKNILKTLICALFKRVNVICCFYFHSMKIMRASFIVCVPFPVPCSSLLQFPGNTCYRNYFYFTHSLRAWIGRNANSDKTLLTSSLR